MNKRHLALATLLVIAPVAVFSNDRRLEALAAHIGREVSIVLHMSDDEEHTTPLPELVAHGKRLFDAVWTHEEGAGRPLTKGTGRGLSDPSEPLMGARSFNRISGPDAGSCAGCHNAPYGITGGGGDFVTSVFVLGQRFDFVTLDPKDTVATKGTVDERGQTANMQTIANLRATTGMFGSGYLELLAREITADLQAIRDTLRPGESKELVSKGIRFGRIARKPDGLWDVTKVEGISRLSLLTASSIDPPTLILRPWHQAGNVISLREFTNNAYNHHHGIQPTERFGVDTDHDGDAFRNEMTRADVTAVTIFQAAMAVPGRVIPRSEAVEKAVLTGEKTFARVGCASCHIPSLPLDSTVFVEPNPYNPAGNLRPGDAEPVRVDLADARLPQPRLAPAPGQRGVTVAAYTDFKLHDITSGADDPNAEVLDMNHGPWSPKFAAGNRKFLTKRLWGAANEPPYFHHGRFTTMRQAILAHAGEALESRKAFEAASKYEQNAVIEFLKTLQVLPPGTTSLVVDENYQPRAWPPQ
ncbi:MAG TPA: di-heme oxidoredictase family protein [Thermoanaerobaculia bacterium]|nr:di-heme oxidoredictase family protein [Thermoanaerobaculia bacterium]